jgi:hypothetical protein
MKRAPAARARRHVARLAVACAAMLGRPHGAHAAGPLGPDGAPIRTSRYGVDLTQTPILAGARVTGLAGAYVAIAEGTDGDIQNPATPAVRTPYSVDHFDYELGLGATLPATLTSTDFFNTGHGRTQLSDASQGGFVFLTPAANLAWGALGLGATAELQTYSLRRNTTGANGRRDELSARFAVIHLQAAYQFAERDLVVGGGARVLSLDVSNPAAPEGQTDLFSTTGAGVELGAVYMPAGEPFRIGAAFRSAVRTQPDAQSRLTPNAQGDRLIGDLSDPVNAFWLPDRVDMPWDLNVGLALSIGPRPFNPRWIDPRDRELEAERAIERRTAEREYRRERLLRRLAAEGHLDEASRAAEDALVDADQAVDELHVAEVARLHRLFLKHRAAALPRRYVLVSMSLLVTGKVEDAVGIESFLQRVVARSGTRIGYSPRLGIETEAIPHWLKLRAGTYGEPSRFPTSSNRLHATFGFDAKLFPWTVFGLFDEETEWRLSSSFDAAPRFFGWGVAIGVWH